MRSPTRRSTSERELTLPALTAFDGERLEPYGDYDAVDFSDRDFSGQDASDARFLECRLERCRVDGLSMSRTRITESLLSEVHGTTVDLADSTWRDSRVSGGRLGAVTLIGASWSGIRVLGCHLGFVNLAGARFEDVRFEGCEIGGLDARTAHLRSVAFVDCSVDDLNVAGATLSDVDLSGARLRALIGVESLRGAIVSEAQLADLAPIFAAELGLEVRPTRSDRSAD
jgi:uncharacterized protein YjbI with pentapeptide repeats